MYKPIFLHIAAHQNLWVSMTPKPSATLSLKEITKWREDKRNKMLILIEERKREKEYKVYAY